MLHLHRVVSDAVTFQGFPQEQKNTATPLSVGTSSESAAVCLQRSQGRENYRPGRRCRGLLCYQSQGGVALVVTLDIRARASALQKPTRL